MSDFIIDPKTNCICCRLPLEDSPYKNKSLCRTCGETPSHHHKALYEAFMKRNPK